MGGVYLLSSCFVPYLSLVLLWDIAIILDLIHFILNNTEVSPNLRSVSWWITLMACTKLSWSHSMSSPLIPGNSMFSFILRQSYSDLLMECMRVSLLVREAWSEGLTIEVNNRFLSHVGPQHLVCSALGENMLETILKSLLCWLSSSKNQIARNLSI